MTSSQTAFVMGFLDGLKRNRFNTTAQISAKFPHLSVADVAIYLNGQQDGISRDNYRYDLIRKEVADVA